jgi:hypothetical protein
MSPYSSVYLSFAPLAEQNSPSNSNICERTWSGLEAKEKRTWEGGEKFIFLSRIRELEIFFLFEFWRIRERSLTLLQSRGYSKCYESSKILFFALIQKSLIL